MAETGHQVSDFLTQAGSLYPCNSFNNFSNYVYIVEIFKYQKGKIEGENYGSSPNDNHCSIVCIWVDF